MELHRPLNYYGKSIKFLSRGNYGAVEIFEDKTGKRTAIKYFNEVGENRISGDFIRETSITQAIQHPNVINVLDIGLTKEGINYIVYELAENDLFDYIKNGSKGETDLNRNLAYQICLGLSAIHQAGYIHMDIKSDNILLFNNNTIAKITDFGLSEDQLCGNSNYTFDIPINSFSAPELIKKYRIDNKVDIWALGLTFYHLFTGRELIPFNMEPERIEKFIITRMGKQLESYISSYIQDLLLMDLLIRMLRINPQERISVFEILIHPFFRGISINLLYPLKCNEIFNLRTELQSSNYIEGQTIITAKNRSFIFSIILEIGFRLKMKGNNIIRVLNIIDYYASKYNYTIKKESHYGYIVYGALLLGVVYGSDNPSFDIDPSYDWSSIMRFSQVVYRFLNYKINYITAYDYLDQIYNFNDKYSIIIMVLLYMSPKSFNWSQVQIAEITLNIVKAIRSQSKFPYPELLQEIKKNIPNLLVNYDEIIMYFSL